MRPPEQLLSTGEVELCLEAFGDPGDPVVLLVAGAQASMDWWPDDLCAALAAGGRRVVRYDHRDTGRSTTDPPGAPTYDGNALVRDCLALVRHLGPAPVHLVGLSMGGGIVQSVALAHPGRVASLSVLSSSPVGGVDDAALPPPTAAVLAAFAAPDPDPDWADRDAVVAWFLAGERLFAGALGVDEAAVRATATVVVERSPRIASAANHWLVVGGPTEPDLDVTALVVPTLVVHGSDDPLFPLAHGRALVDAVPGARLLVVPGMGHQVPPRSTWPLVLPALLARTADVPVRDRCP